LADEKRPLAEWLPLGDVVTGEYKKFSLTVTANVADMTERAAKAVLAIERARNVEPVQVVMWSALGFLGLLLVAALVVKGPWSDRLLETTVIAVAIIAAPALLAKFLKKGKD